MLHKVQPAASVSFKISSKLSTSSSNNNINIPNGIKGNTGNSSSNSNSSNNNNNSNTGNNINDEGNTLCYIEKVALELEKSFVDVLKTLTREYLGPLREYVSAQVRAGSIQPSQAETLQRDLSTIFEGTEALLTAATGALGYIQRCVLSRSRFWLASAYANCSGYFEAYSAFLAGQARAIDVLRAVEAPGHLLGAQVERIREGLRGRGRLGDLLWFCSARATHLLRLAGQQRNLHGALSESQRAWVRAHYFAINRANTVTQGKIAREVERLQGAAMKGLAWNPDVERSYRRLEAISAAAGALEAAYQTLDMARALADPLSLASSSQTGGTGRIYLGKLPGVLIDNAAHYGLAQEVPVWILRFSDGFGAAIEDSEEKEKEKKKENEKRYRLVCWYKLGAATLTQVADPRGTRTVFKAAAVPDAGLLQPTSALPPGWKYSEKGRQRNYTYEQLGITLHVPPTYDMAAAAAESDRLFAVGNDECTRAWTDFADNVQKAREKRCAQLQLQQQQQQQQQQQLQQQQQPQDDSSNNSDEHSDGSSQQGSDTVIAGTLTLNNSNNGSGGDSGNSLFGSSGSISLGVLGPYKVIGSDIEEVIRYEERVYPGAYTPVFMRMAINSLVAHGLGEEGIFRVGWEQRALDDLYARINTGQRVSFEGQPPHLTANMFKLLLREAATSLIPSSLFGPLLAVMELPEEQRAAEFAVRLRAGLSERRFQAVRDLFHFLHIVATNSGFNHMLTTNLAILFAVNIFWESERMRSDLHLITRSNDVVATILNNFEAIFGSSVVNGGVTRLPTVDPFVGLCNRHVNGKVPFRTLTSIVPVQADAAGQAEKKMLLSIDRDGNVTCWDATEDAGLVGSFTIAHKDFLCAAAVGRYLWVSLHKGEGIVVYDVEGALSTSKGTTLAPIASLDVPNAMCILGNSNDGSVWCGAENSIHIFSGETLEKYGVIEESGFITAIAAVGDTIWCGVYKSGAAEQQTIHVWDAATSQLISSFPAHTTRITALCPTENGTVWSGTSNGVISVWSAKTYKRIKKIVHHGSVISAMCSFGGQVWTGSLDKSIFLWSATTNEYVGELKGYHSEPVNAMAPAKLPDGKWLVWTSSSDRSICVWKSSKLPGYFDKHLE